MTEEVVVARMGREHARDVAALHIQGIPTGFISSLGINFVTALYEGIGASESSFCFVGLRDSKVVGFAAFTENLSSLYRSVLSRCGWKLVLKSVSKMFSLSRIKKVLETLFYPSRIEKLELPSAEFLSMAVSVEGRGKGLATQFLRQGFAECRRRGIPKLKIFAAVDIIPINKLYEKQGFDLAGQMENHGIVSNIYVADTSREII